MERYHHTVKEPKRFRKLKIGGLVLLVLYGSNFLNKYIDSRAVFLQYVNLGLQQSRLIRDQDQLERRLRKGRISEPVESVLENIMELREEIGRNRLRLRELERKSVEIYDEGLKPWLYLIE